LMPILINLWQRLLVTPSLTFGRTLPTQSGEINAVTLATVLVSNGRFWMWTEAES
jgi:hypothetical protein